MSACTSNRKGFKLEGAPERVRRGTRAALRRPSIGWIAGVGHAGHGWEMSRSLRDAGLAEDPLPDDLIPVQKGRCDLLALGFAPELLQQGGQ